MRRSSSAAVTSAPLKRCAIYTRKSTTMGLEQEFNTLDAQREACEAYIRSQASVGWTTLTDRYDDGGFTGANIDRPAFQRLLADVEAGRVDTVVVYKLDRVSRSLLDFATVMNRLNRAGVGFVSVTQNFSTADAVGRMTLNLLATFAEFEREQIGERTRDKMAASRRRGKWTGGVVPLGYRIVDKKLVIDAQEAELVREVFELYLEQHSALAVAQTLRDRGRATGRYLANSGRIREARAWGKGDVLSVLKKPLYIGLMRYRDELHEGEHEAIVDQRTFELARRLLARTNGGRTPRRRNPDYLLSGILMCAGCGSALTAASSRKGGREYRYYRCTKRDREGRSACPTRPMSASAIEDYVAQRLREAIVESDLAASAASAIGRAETRRRNLTIERDHLTGWIASTAAADANNIVGSLGELEHRLAEIEADILALDATKLEACWIAQCLRDFNDVWDVLTSQNRGRLVRAVVERVDVDDGGGEVRITLVDLSSSEKESMSA
jgi:site-specific DNA recombinase